MANVSRGDLSAGTHTVSVGAGVLQNVWVAVNANDSAGVSAWDGDPSRDGKLLWTVKVAGNPDDNYSYVCGLNVKFSNSLYVVVDGTPYTAGVHVG